MSSKKTLLRLCLVPVFMLLSVTLAFAQTGKLKGKVTDCYGDPGTGANILVEGTGRGAAADLEGDYQIVGIPVGDYIMKVSYVGCEPQTRSIRIRSNDTTTEDFALKTAGGDSGIQLDELIAVATFDARKDTDPVTKASVGAAEIAALPVENVSDIVNLQAGVVNGRFRGSRGGEVLYQIDGVAVNDAYSGGQSVTVENNSVEELQVITGAFNAEYGQAMSGVVNVVTKKGSDKFSGSLNTFSGDYFSNRTSLFTGIDKVSPISDLNGEFDLSGPIVKSKLHFFVSGRYYSSEGYRQGRNVFNLNDNGLRNGLLTVLNLSGSGDSTLVAMDPYQKLSGQAKLTWMVSPKLFITLNSLYSQDESKNYSHYLTFLPENRRTNKGNNQLFFLKAQHFLSNNTYYDLALSRNQYDFKNYLFEDALDTRYLPADLSGSFLSNQFSSFATGGTDNGRYQRTGNTNTLKFDLSSQVNKANFVKFGAEFKTHNISVLDQYTSVINPVYNAAGQVQSATRTLNDNENYNAKPVEAAFYVQDKIEIKDMVVNIGVRADYFDSNGKVFIDNTSPCVLPDNRSLPECSTDPNNSAIPDKALRDAKSTFQISPRLSLAFPISSTGRIHFSYGEFFQTPNIGLLYQNPQFRLGAGGSGLQGLFGNAELNPQRTTSGELGLKQALSKTTVVEASVYFRDIRGLAGSGGEVYEVQGTSVRYGRLSNSEFGFVKGFILRYDQRVGNGFSINADYTYQVARGNSSDPNAAYGALAAYNEPEKTLVFLDWDQRHTLNLGLFYNTKGWDFAAINNYGSGNPYTPTYDPSIGTPIRPAGSITNIERRPSTLNTSLQAYKNFSVAGKTVALKVRVDNLFDTANEYGVYGETGRATYSRYKIREGANFIGQTQYLDQNYIRPDFYGAPRRVTVGLSYRF